MPTDRHRQPILLLIAALASLGATASNVRGELSLSFYSGASLTHDSDAKLTQPGGTNLSFTGIEWDGDSFKSPIYFGARITYWHDPLPNLGFAIDFTHAKIIANPTDTVTATGTRGGVPVNAVEPLSNTFSALQLSHGLNLVTANVLYRWFPTGQRDDSLLGRLQPYVGIGGGVAIPHVEVTTAVSRTFEYQAAGAAFQVLAGVNIDIVKHLSLFVEYKFTYADINADLTGGGSFKVEPLTHHFIFGISVHF